MAYPDSDFPMRPCFAYGSNMNPDTFQDRCPGSRVLGRAVLVDHRWRIHGRGVATVVPHSNSRVPGVLLGLSAIDEAGLDEAEGVASHVYRREFLSVKSLDGTWTRALVYVANDASEGAPRPGYLERVVAGARHHALPRSHVRELESWRQGPPAPGSGRFPVFVYGTLKRGQWNHGLLDDAGFVGGAVTANRHALRLDGLPMLDRHTAHSQVHGELYLVSQETLQSLDQLEGHPDFYRRSVEPVILGDGSIEWAWIYFHTCPTGRVIESGRYGD